MSPLAYPLSLQPLVALIGYALTLTKCVLKDILLQVVLRLLLDFCELSHLRRCLTFFFSLSYQRSWVSKYKFTELDYVPHVDGQGLSLFHGELRDVVTRFASDCVFVVHVWC